MATAVAARGLDIKDVKHVVNYEMPTEVEEWTTILPSWLFLQLDGVKIKDRSNWLCGEPKSCYFNRLTIGEGATRSPIPGEFLPRLHNQGKDSEQIQWSSALKEEAFSWFKLHKNQVFWCLTWLRIKTDWRTWKEDRERKRGVTVRPTARSDLDYVWKLFK